MFFDTVRMGYTFRLSLSHESEQFGSLHMCASRKDICQSGSRIWYPRALSQPRYQWSILGPYILYAHSPASFCHTLRSETRDTVGLMLAQRHRQWTSISSTLGEYFLLPVIIFTHRLRRISSKLNQKFKFSPTWSCVSLPRPTTPSEWKLLIVVEFESAHYQSSKFNAKFCFILFLFHDK